jgi:hypothetical protein
VFFVGQSDDLTPNEYEVAYREAYGTPKTAVELTDEGKLERFNAAIAELRAPEILGMVITKDEEGAEAKTKGLRFMGQRFVPDSFVFRRLVHPNVPERMLPKALDFFAAIGSERAFEHVVESDVHREKLSEVRDVVRGWGVDVYTQNLYWSWIYSLRPLLDPPPPGVPIFMQSDAWLDKQLFTALGSWTELKHDTLLYTKPVYAEMGAGGLPPPEPVPPKGYVEPVPETFARVAALAEMTRVGLERRGLIGDAEKKALAKIEELALKLAAIAVKQLSNGTVTREEYELIRFYGGKIEELTFAGTDEIDVDSGGMPEGGEALQIAIVADVANDPNGFVLEEAIGRVFNIRAVVPIEGKLVLAEGGVFSHYEFKQPIADRLTDEAWRKKVERGDLPPLAEWTSSFLVEDAVNQKTAERVRFFTERMIESLWYTTMSNVDGVLAGEAREQFEKQIADLKSRSEYIGRERLSIEFLSFDFRMDHEAVVTTRERWKDDLNKGDPVEEDLTKLAERGPYETVATYTLVFEDDQWKVSKLIYRPALPEWKK